MCKHMPTPLPTLAEAAPAAAAVAVQKANDDAAQAVEAALVQAANEDAEAVEARAGQSRAKIGCLHLKGHLND